MSNEFTNLFYKIDYEGFDYALREYSDWSEIEDPEFHRLRSAFVTAAEKLEGYIRQFEDEAYENAGDDDYEDEDAT